MTNPPRILTARERDLDVAEFRRVLVESGLGATRPVDDAPRLKHMLAEANLVMTARLAVPGRPLVGLARGITDFTWVCYLSELAVTRSAQGLGAGRALLDAARAELGPRVALVLASMPDVVGFYEQVGMERLPDCFWYRRTA